MRIRTGVATLLLGSAMTTIWATPALAQNTGGSGSQADQGASSGEIIVTARKREETLLDVPVAMTALGREALDRYASSDFAGIANQVPGLIVQTTPGGAGGSIALRGVTSSNSNPTIDQAVALNVDGVQPGSAAIMRLSQIDLQQIEVLKGPQALFFGKNSPGGVISIRTADPKDYFEASVQLGYEFEAREKTAQVMVSGPLAENLKGRLVIYGNDMSGYFKNTAEAFPGFTYAPEDRRAPKGKEFYARGTLLFDPSDGFSVRAKYSFSKRNGSSPYNTQQRINCPYGTPQTLGYPTTVECKADDKYTNGGLNPAMVAGVPALAQDPTDRGRTVQHLASLEMNYQVAPSVTLTSVSGFYQIDDEFMGSASYQDGTPLIAGTYINRRELSQEFRVTTDFADSPVNLTMGGFYQDVKFKQRIPLGIDLFALGAAAAPGIAFSPSDNRFGMDGQTISAFGQARWNITDKLELAGGVRYSREKKSLVINTLTGRKIPAKDHVQFSDWSPEATLTFKPNSNLTLFGAYRNGFKTGGFNTGGGSYSNGQKVDYQPEDASGFEVGAKFARGPVRFNLTAYTYKYKDMQVSTFDPATITQTVVNAASARIKGIEADVNYRTPIQGLSLRGSINYNNARYLDFLVGCYTGQTIAQGCNINPGPSGAFRQQDFQGRQLLLAPDWTGNAGFTFEQSIGSSLRLILTGDATFSSSFFGQLEEAPYGKQSNYAMFDAGLRLSDNDDRWEVALLGRNLSEVYRARFVSQVSFTGISSRTGTNLAGGLSDYSGQINRGREIRLQFKYNFR